jgi:hypothetical protein
MWVIGCGAPVSIRELIVCDFGMAVFGQQVTLHLGMCLPLAKVFDQSVSVAAFNGHSF